MNASENERKSFILPSQVRAARAMLGWSQAELSAACNVPLMTLHRLENGQSKPQRRTIEAVRTALEAAGIEFTNGNAPGVRLVGSGNL